MPWRISPRTGNNGQGGGWTENSVSNPDDEPWFPSVGPRLGSWGQTIKRAGTEAEWAWDEGDIPGYVEALAETGQNTVICDINTERDWEEF